MNRNKKQFKQNQRSNDRQSKRNKEAMKPMDKEDARSKDDKKFDLINKHNDGNDPDYYFTNKDLAEQAATFPFPYFLGNRDTILGQNIPTVEVIRLNPAVGVTRSDNQGVVEYQTGTNMAAQKLYTRLSVASGRTATYQPNDVMMALLAVTSLAESIEHARRFFGIATTYSQRNRVFAWKILSMIANKATLTFGQDFVMHMADYRMQLNMIITKINQIPLFADIGFVRKSLEMYQKVYMDELSETAQIYVFSPESMWILDETGETGSVLKTTLLSSAQNFGNILTTLNNAADALLNSTTLNAVYADMFNYQAKFSANFLSLDYVLEGYSVIPEYNQRVLQQIHNLTIVGLPGGTVSGYRVTASNDVESDANNGLLLYNPVLGSLPVNDLVFDFETSAPDLVDKIDNIKFAAMGDEVTGSGSALVYINAVLPDHYVTRVTISGARPEDYVVINANVSAQTYGVNVATVNGDYSTVSNNDVIQRLMCKFDHNFLCVSRTSSGVSGIFGDLNYFTTMDKDHFRRINDLEYQGLFELR